MTTYPPIQDRSRHLRKLHALGKERGLAHEALRSFVGVVSLSNASIEQLQSACTQLDAMPSSQGGQYSSPLPREPRAHWRPSLPQAPKPRAKAQTLGWCYQCHLPSQTSLCKSCRKHLDRPKPQSTHQAPALDLGPIATPHLAIRGIDHALITKLLAEGAYSYDTEHHADRYEWAGYLKSDALADIEGWMRRHGAIQPSSILPNYWALENKHLKLSINTTKSGRTHITLLDLSDPPTPPTNRITQPQRSELCEVMA